MATCRSASCIVAIIMIMLVAASGSRSEPSASFVATRSDDSPTCLEEIGRVRPAPAISNNKRPATTPNDLFVDVLLAFVSLALLPFQIAKKVQEKVTRFVTLIATFLIDRLLEKLLEPVAPLACA